MQNFTMGNLSDWVRIETGEPYTFGTPRHGYRDFRLKVMCDRMIAVRAILADTEWIVGVGMGRFDVRFAAQEDFCLVATATDGASDASVYFKTGIDTGTIIRHLPTFTTPRPSRDVASDDVKRMMHIMRLNQQRHDAMVRADLARLRGEVTRAQSQASKPAEPVKPVEQGEESDA